MALGRSIMRIVGLYCLAQIFLTATGTSQETTKYGFFNVINTIPLEEPLYIYVDSYEVTEGEGLKCGDYTGMMGWKEGKYTLKFNQKDCEPFTAPISVEKGKSPIIYVYYQEERDEATGETKRKILAKSAPTEAAGSGHRLGVLNSSTHNALLNVTINGEAMEIETGRTKRISPWNGRKIEVKYKDKVVLQKEGLREGSYICILTDTPSGDIGGMVIADSVATFEPMEGSAADQAGEEKVAEEAPAPAEKEPNS